MGMLWQDVRFATRMFGKNLGFTAIAVLALGLGIGASTSTFSVAEAFLIHPLPFRNLDRLAVILELAPHETRDTSGVSAGNYADWKKQAHSFEQLAASRWHSVNLTGAGMAVELTAFDVETNFFDSMGVKPVLGRDFVAQEGEPGNEQEVLLSDGVWRRQFGGDPRIVGQIIHLNDKPVTVIGVMGTNAVLPPTADMWMPLALSQKEWTDRSNHQLTVIGRLRNGVSLEQAQAEMRTIAQRLSDAYPQTNRDWSARVMSLNRAVVGDYTRQYTLMMIGAVGFVLLIACANVANLQLARATGRQKEMALRVAVGATRWQIVRQILVESVLLGFAGASVGVLLAAWELHLILAAMPPEVAKYVGGWDQIRLDPATILFAAGAAVAAGILAGIVPALQSSRVALNETLKEGGRGTTPGRGRHHMRNALVVAQVAIALVLLIGAGLMIKGFSNLLALNENYHPQSLLTMRLHLPDRPAYRDRHVRAQFYERALAQLTQLPGVEATGAANSVPFGNFENRMRFSIEGRPVTDASSARIALNVVSSPNYFQMMGIPVLRGRGFQNSDGPDAPGVAVISQRLANLNFAGEDPLGRHIKLGPDDSPNPWLTIVGVVADAQYNWTDRLPEAVVYRSAAQAPEGGTYLLLRAPRDVSRLAGPARTAVASVDADTPVFEVKTMEAVVHDSVIGLAYTAVMLGVAGIVALVLAMVGVYGVMAYLVGERVHEIGVRMALGATRSNILAMVLRRGLALTLAGMAMGLPGAFALAYLLASLFYGVRATDAGTFIGISFLLIAIAGVACYVPARRATRVDPMVALRYE